MSDHAEMDFDSLRPAGSAPQRRSEASLEPRDRAFDLNSLTVLSIMKTTVHLTPVFGPGPAASATLVQLDDRAADAQLFPRIRMVVLGVVSAVGQQAVDTDPFARTAQHRRQQRRILRRPVAHQGMNQQMGRVVARQRELGPATQFIAFLAGSVGIMRRAVSRLQARGVDAGLLLPAQKAKTASSNLWNRLF